MICEWIVRWIKRYATVVGAVVVFAVTYVLVLAINAGAAGAAWVQAIGTILALVGAIYLPILHSDHVAKKQQQNILGQMRLIAEDCYEKLWMLTNCFLIPDKESRMIGAYISNGRTQEWDSVITALNQIPLQEVPPEHVTTLAVMRTAASQAAFVCGQLEGWKADGSNLEVVELLRGRRDILCLNKERLPWPEGVPDTIDKANQKAGLEHESIFHPLNPMLVAGAKVYRQYMGSDRENPDWVRVQIVFPYGDEAPVNFHLERELPPGWINLGEAECAVRAQADACIGEIYSRYL